MTELSSPLDPRGFPLGVAWYPEWEPPGAWEADLEGMRQAGLNTVRICEFSWEHIQPEPGRFDFALYDAVVRRCDELGFGIVLGVDTVRPPNWVFERYPDMHLLDNLGRPAPGTWPVHCFNHPAFAELSSAYIARFVPRYASSPALLYYQVDNEPAYHARGAAQGARRLSYCWCHHCQTRFRAWLAKRYAGDTPPLIRDPFPQPEVMGELLWLEWRSFHDETNVRRTAWVAEEVRRHDRRHPVTTNVMVGSAFGASTSKLAHDVYGLARVLDVFGMDLYPDVRVDYAPAESLVFSLSRQLGGDRGFHCLETQPTTISGAEGFWQAQERGFQKHGDDRQLIPRGWRPLAYGARSLLYWVWRLQMPNVWSLARPDGSPTEFTRQTARLAGEIARAWPEIGRSRARPAEVAILHTRETAHLAARQDMPEVPGEAVKGAFAALWRRRIPADVLDEAGALQGLVRYRAVVAPFLYVLTAPLAEALRRYVEGGGLLIWDARSGSYGQRDGRFHEYAGASQVRLSYETAPAGGLDRLFGYRCRMPYAAASPSLTLSRPVGGLAAGAVIPGRMWWDAWEPSSGAEVLGATQGGTPGVVRHRAGSGQTIAFAADVFRAAPDGGGPLGALLAAIVGETGARPPAQVEGLDHEADAKLEVVLRDLPDGLLAFVINASSAPCAPLLRLPADGPALDLLTGDAFSPRDGAYAVPMEPYGVRVLESRGDEPGAAR